jgi:hypothetical protein
MKTLEQLNQLTEEAFNFGAALKRLIEIAKRDTGQSSKVADFLLAWWNGEECGRFDFRTMWGVDSAIVNDMAIVFAWIGHNQHYPDQLGYGRDFEFLVRHWRPQLGPAAAIEIAIADAEAGVTWWNKLTPAQRRYWMERAANTGVAADAWHAFKQAQRPILGEQR